MNPHQGIRTFVLIALLFSWGSTWVDVTNRQMPDGNFWRLVLQQSDGEDPDFGFNTSTVASPLGGEKGSKDGPYSEPDFGCNSHTICAPFEEEKALGICGAATLPG